MSAHSHRRSKTRCAILGVLSFEPSTGYEIRRLLSETTVHFWKESYGQIYPTLEALREEGKIEVVERSTEGRPQVTYRILPPGHEELITWIRSPDFHLRPGRNELLLKLFFARREDAPSLIPQVESYLGQMQDLSRTYTAYRDDSDPDTLPADSLQLVGTTIDYGISAATMQLEWCRRTIATLKSLTEDG